MERMSNMHSKAAQDAFRGRFPQSASMRLSEIIQHTGEAAWTQVDAACTVGVGSADTPDTFKIGADSAKMAIGAGAAVGIQAYGQVANDNTNMATGGYTHIKFWMRSSVALAAGDFMIGLSNAASALTLPDDVGQFVNIPAIAANTWTRFTIALNAVQKALTSVSSVQLNMVTDKTVNIYIDDVRFCKYEADGSSEIAPLATYTLNNTNADGINSEMWLLPFQAGLISVFNLPQDLAIQAYQGTPGAYATTDIKSGKTPLDTGQTVIDMIRGATALVLYPGAELASGEAFEIEVA